MKIDDTTGSTEITEVYDDGKSKIARKNVERILIVLQVDNEMLPHDLSIER